MTEAAISQSDMTVARRNTDETRAESQDRQTISIWDKLAERLWRHAEETGEMDTRSFKGLV
mgnify:CR=1 FL=1